ncbi:MAG TPA: NADH-quinone oxidoreductase subunit L, partial [Tenuifilaceae bacterium]|nr:NADH-quinone oxidoreductase subunit L [Tenuifilaceae bacterium]
AFLSIAVGYIPFGNFISSDSMPLESHINWGVASASIIVSFTGIIIAWVLYKKPSNLPERIVSSIKVLYTWAYHKFYIDEVYLFVTKKIIFNLISRPIAWFDRHVVDGAMNGIAWTTSWVSESIKGLQSGQLQKYALAFVSSTIILSALLIYILLNV